MTQANSRTADYPIDALFLERWSPRAFAGEAILERELLTLLEAHPKLGPYVPSPTAMGLGMLIPGYAVLPMVFGGVVQDIWKRLSPKSEDVYNTPLASGFITGEALVLLFLAAAAFK